jgi:hypothetical protein
MLDDQLAANIIRGTKDALAQWCRAVRFQGIIINGATAIGQPGCMVGPRLDSLMAAPLAMLQGDDKAAASIVARTVSDAFDRWRQSVTVPSLMWYPTFAAYPGPVAPPTPNQPCKLSTMTSAGAIEIANAIMLERAMVAAAGPMPGARTAAILKKVAGPLASEFSMFINSKTVMHVLGQGTVQGFSPIGPVGGPVIGMTLGMSGMLL